MASLTARALHETDETLKMLLEQRSRPHVVILDAELNVAFAEPRADLPVALTDAIGEFVRGSRDAINLGERAFGPVEGVLLRVVPLFGAQGRFYAVFLERDARREDLREAVRRFSLTPREVEVLAQILAGNSAAEIAQSLHIAEVTVFDHFKHISQKTNARNRADMLAKIFNWQSSLKSREWGHVVPMRPTARRYRHW